MNPSFGLDLARSHQQDLLRHAHKHRRVSRNQWRLHFQQSKMRTAIAANDTRDLVSPLDGAITVALEPFSTASGNRADSH